MTEDFAVLDFAVVQAAPATVARALADAWPQATAPDTTTAPETRSNGGLLGRLMARRQSAAPPPPTTTLRLHPAGAVPVPPYARADTRSPAMADSALRLSAPRAPRAGDVTLIELLEDLNGDAKLCKALSKSLPDTEVFFFRYSGTLHPGAHFAFHVYRNGRALRRAMSLSLQGDHGEAPWHATDSGMPHPAEADSLPPPEAPAAEIMTPERQGAILSALGIEAEALFTDLRQRSDVIVLSPAPGGAPLSELPADRRRDLRVPPAFAAQATESTPPEQPASPPLQAPTAKAQAPDTQPAPLARALSPKAPDAPVPDSPQAWEQEVTALLLACVEAGLPEAQRVAWLQGFTARLERGDVEDALDEAATLIAKTDRPQSDRDAATGRLRTLYAHLRPQQTG